MAFFSNDKKHPVPVQHKRKEHSSDSALTILTSGCHFSGKLYCKGSSRIGGKIDGEIISEGLLIIEEGAIINADVKVEETILHGTFRGRLESSIKVQLTKTANFEGELITPVLSIMEGAECNGQITMTSGLQDKKVEEFKPRVHVNEDHSKKKTAGYKEVNLGHKDIGSSGPSPDPSVIR